VARLRRPRRRTLAAALVAVGGLAALLVIPSVVDAGHPPRPDSLAPAEVSRLASIARELAFNNPDAENGEDGFADRRGTRLDRNVELIVRNPY
jgi:hypothetical protein